MSYDDIENSEYDGAPVEIFMFAHDTDIWRYSSGAEVVHDSETYSPVAVGREGEIHISGEPDKANIIVEMPIDLEVSQLFLNGSPENIVSLTVFRLHEPNGEYEIYWKGRIVSIEWDDGPYAKGHCESIFSSLKRQGLRGRYTRSCRHDLYSDECGLDKDDYDVACTVTAVDGNSISFTVDDSSEYDDDYFTAGMVYADGAWRMIMTHTASPLEITVMSPIAGLAVDDPIMLYPGCDHTLTTCDEKFSNSINYGGFPWIPTKNPFRGSLV